MMFSVSLMGRSMQRIWGRALMPSLSSRAAASWLRSDSRSMSGMLMPEIFGYLVVMVLASVMKLSFSLGTNSTNCILLSIEWGRGGFNG